MNKLISYLPILYIVFVVHSSYEFYLKHQETVSELKGQIPRIKRSIAKIKKERKQVDKYLKDIAEAKQKIELVAKEVENIQKKLPNDIDDTKNLSTIKGVADNLNIREVFLTPKGSEDKGFYFTRQYEFKGKGTFLQILIFLEKISENERLLNIKSLILARAKKQQRGRFQTIDFQAIVEAYRYNSNYKEDRGIDKIESEYNKPLPRASKNKGRRKNLRKRLLLN